MKKTLVAYGIVITLTMVMGCASTTRIAISRPPVQTASNPYFEVRFEPLKSSGNFFDSFRLTVSNKTDGNLAIDWNKTRYIYSGNAQEGFVFKGIAPKDVRTGTVPPDVVPARQTVAKVIYPLKLIAWVPAQKRVLDEGLGPGLIPDGVSGISLSIMLDGKEMTEEITVTIEEKVVQ